MELEIRSKKINGDECDYEKNSMKIKFNSDDDLPLKKSIKISQYYYNYLDDTLYELNI